jgi:hypothetical protein
MCAYSDALAECALGVLGSCGLVRFARVVLVFGVGAEIDESEVARGGGGRRDADGNACSAKREAGRSKIVRGGSEGLKYNRTLLTPIISLKLGLRACISQSRFLAHSFATIDLRLALLHPSGKNLTRLKWPVHATHSKRPLSLLQLLQATPVLSQRPEMPLSLRHHKPT